MRSAGSPHDLHQATRSLVDLKGDLAWARSLLSSEEQSGKPFPASVHPLAAGTIIPRARPGWPYANFTADDTRPAWWMD